MHRFYREKLIRIQMLLLVRTAGQEIRTDLPGALLYFLQKDYLFWHQCNCISVRFQLLNLFYIPKTH